MKFLSKNVVFLFQFILMGLGVAFLWLLFTGKLNSQTTNNLVADISPDSSISETTNSQSSTNSNSSSNINAHGHLSFASAVEKAQPAVVNIHTNIVDEKLVRTPLGVRSMLRNRRGLGSGVIVDKAGYIITNHHVIQNINAIAVVLSNGNSVQAKLIGTDVDTDLALLQITTPLSDLDLSSIEFASSDNLHVGDIVLAIGNPQGIGQTVTQGIVSATGRTNLALATYEDFIQTDAAISSGNSGGALINSNGELIGINTAVLSQRGENYGIGFAIPSNLAKGVFNELRDNGRVIRGWLGIETGRPNSLYYHQQLNVELNYAGAMVGKIQIGSPADIGGLNPYDIITAINGEKIGPKEEAKATYLIASLKPKDKVKLSVQRGDQNFDVEIEVAEKPTRQN